MNINKLARKIAINESGKKQVSIGQVKEILRLNALICHQDPETKKAFEQYGARVDRQEKKKCSKK